MAGSAVERNKLWMVSPAFCPKVTLNPVKAPAALHCLWTGPWLTKSLLDIQCSAVNVGLDPNSLLKALTAEEKFSVNAILIRSNLEEMSVFPL